MSLAVDSQSFDLFLLLYNNIEIKASVLESSLLLNRLYFEPCAVLYFPVNLCNVLCFFVVFDQFRANFHSRKCCQDVCRS